MDLLSFETIQVNQHDWSFESFEYKARNPTPQWREELHDPPNQKGFGTFWSHSNHPKVGVISYQQPITKSIKVVINQILSRWLTCIPLDGDIGTCRTPMMQTPCVALLCRCKLLPKSKMWHLCWQFAAPRTGPGWPVPARQGVGPSRRPQKASWSNRSAKGTRLSVKLCLSQFFHANKEI